MVSSIYLIITYKKIANYTKMYKNNMPESLMHIFCHVHTYMWVAYGMSIDRVEDLWVYCMIMVSSAPSSMVHSLLSRLSQVSYPWTRRRRWISCSMWPLWILVVGSSGCGWDQQGLLLRARSGSGYVRNSKENMSVHEYVMLRWLSTWGPMISMH